MSGSNGWLPPYDAPTGCAWLCPDCDSWASLRENAHAHQIFTGHGKPTHGDQPKAEGAAASAAPSEADRVGRLLAEALAALRRRSPAVGMPTELADEIDAALAEARQMGWLK